MFVPQGIFYNVWWHALLFSLSQKRSLTQTFGPLDFFLFLFISCFVDIKKRALLISSVLIMKKKTFFNQR